MKPIASADLPQGSEWMYEVKYDGFRCHLHWEKNGNIKLISKRNKDMTDNFPEITAACSKMEKAISDMLPLLLDGELVILNNDFQANFPALQTRGRTKKREKIIQSAKKRPATLMVFDVLVKKSEEQINKSFEMRKKQLKRLFDLLPEQERLRYVPAFHDDAKLKQHIFDHQGEGIIAKRKESTYKLGKSHRDWFKVKNWRTIQVFLTSYNPGNGYFTAEVYDGAKTITVGKCKHGLQDEEEKAIKQLFMTSGEKSGDLYDLPPAICVNIHTLGAADGELREPEFAGVITQTKPAECTLAKLRRDLAMLPSEIDITNPDKLYFPKADGTKSDFLIYMRHVAPYMLPFLKNRSITLIRCPDGVRGERFFQKHLPDYAPDLFPRRKDQVIVCDRLNALIWLANHGALEYHVPFQAIDSSVPLEIVFDLDPPDREHFYLAVQAAELIKTMLDQLELISFIKTSGNKGLQIHIPIPTGSLTYDETAVFTEAIATVVENVHPNLFTTERMKDKRKGRLYIDYIQHGKNKTIIAPYSPRKTEEGTVAMPLNWEEVNENLHPTQFTIQNAIERIQTKGCPFRNYFEQANKQNLEPMRKLIGK